MSAHASHSAAGPADEPALVTDLVYDVGAHKGEDAAYYLAKGYRVLAFEANAELVRGCADRFAQEIAEGRLELVEGAVTDSAEATVRFYRHPLSTWGTTSEEMVSRNLMVAPSEAVEVPAVNFAEKLRQTGMPLTFRFEEDSSGPFGSDVGPWLARPAAIARYRRVFLAYRLIGAR
ncbi:MAG TPA: hypothetical protein VN672_06790 [Solirubrobacteraceae bacterium]|nr:hypothetical protein [Solirubrobacteraceae bacterium]